MSDFSQTNLPNDFYVYMYVREDGTPYYVGKGKEKRAWATHKRHVSRPVEPERIHIIEDGLKEQEAFALEVRTIALYGRKDAGTGILRNFTDGGEGASGYRHTPESKKAMSEKRKGRKFSEEHKINLAATSIKKISVNGVIYHGNKEVSKVYGISTTAVSHRARAKSYESRNWWYVEDGYIPRERWKHSEETKNHLSAVKMGDRNPNYGKEYSSEERVAKSRQCTNKREILIEGILYESINGAAKILGVERFTVHNRVRSKSKRFKDWKYARIA